jgi:hypothetical protein
VEAGRAPPFSFDVDEDTLALSGGLPTNVEK